MENDSPVGTEAIMDEDNMAQVDNNPAEDMSGDVEEGKTSNEEIGPDKTKEKQVNDNPAVDISDDLEEGKTSNEEIGPDKTKEKNNEDPYAYANNGDTFTSESFKIEIMNLPKFCGFKQFRKFLNKLNVDPVKIKIPFRANYAFATFRSEQERRSAMAAIDAQKWKGTVLRVKKAAPAADPLLKKRRLETSACETGEDGNKKARLEENALPPDERLKDAVSPDWRFPYDRQLVMKERNMRGFLQSLPSDIIRNNCSLKWWINSQKIKHAGLMCELVKIKASPETENYRNKCEFTVGSSVEGKEKTVGFRLGSYKDGTIHVMSPDACTIIPEVMKIVVKRLENYLQHVSPHTGFDPQSKDGNWRMVTVRTNASSQVMVVMHFNPMQLSQEEINEEKERIKNFFESGEGKDSGVTSLYFQIKNEHRVRGSEDNVEGDYELLQGEPHIHEALLGLTFRISPAAFFQVNTPAAEVLYSTVREWADIGMDSTVLDVCCGTGTIGITMAKHVKKVIGIEMCKEAVDDANINAQLNDVSEKTVFHCGKAEDVLPGLMRTVSEDEDVVAVVDPPRTGLHRDVLKALRKHEFVKRLVYVSCKANSIRNNIIDLMRMPSKQIKGEPFKLTSAVPVDLFPHTKHCELVLLFERGERKVNTTSSEETLKEEKEEEGKCEDKGDNQSPGGDESVKAVVEEPREEECGDVKEETMEGKMEDEESTSRSVEQMDSELPKEAESVQESDEQHVQNS